MTAKFHPNAQWFEDFGSCHCGKPATGILRSYVANEKIRLCCVTCADREIKAEHKRGGFIPDAFLPLKVAAAES